MEKRIIPILLSGGSGVRLWPMSRESYPKQFLPLCSERSMLQDTLMRVADHARYAPPVIVCHHEHRFIVAEHVRQCGVAPGAMLLEPVARNTASACAAGALQAMAMDPEALILVLPADHLIRDLDAFTDAVDRAADVAAQGAIATFGMKPGTAETGFGYIRRGAPISDHSNIYQVREFTEKPDRSTAERFLNDGDYYWNSGMLLCRAATLLGELEKFAPNVLSAAHEAFSLGAADLDFFRLNQGALMDAPNLSIDVAVMENTDKAVVVPCDLGWADVGGWPALWDISAKDHVGNVAVGDVVIEDARNSYVRSEGPLAAVVGVDDVIVVATEDAVLVAGRDKAPDVKAMVEGLRRKGRREPVSHRKVHRPWGCFQSVHAGDRFQVKCLTVHPGAKLSLQKHYHRAEHWVVVQGTALVTRGEEQVLVYENQSIYLPMGTVHRLENPGKVPLNIIEVQSGAYLGEDDIVRLEDTYGR